MSYAMAHSLLRIVGFVMSTLVSVLVTVAWLPEITYIQVRRTEGILWLIIGLWAAIAWLYFGVRMTTYWSRSESKVNAVAVHITVLSLLCLWGAAVVGYESQYLPMIWVATSSHATTGPVLVLKEAPLDSISLGNVQHRLRIVFAALVVAWVLVATLLVDLVVLTVGTFRGIGRVDRLMGKSIYTIGAEAAENRPPSMMYTISGPVGASSLEAVDPYSPLLPKVSSPTSSLSSASSSVRRTSRPTLKINTAPTGPRAPPPRLSRLGYRPRPAGAVVPRFSVDCLRPAPRPPRDDPPPSYHYVRPSLNLFRRTSTLSLTSLEAEEPSDVSIASVPSLVVDEPSSPTPTDEDEDEDEDAVWTTVSLRSVTRPPQHKYTAVPKGYSPYSSNYPYFSAPSPPGQRGSLESDEVVAVNYNSYVPTGTGGGVRIAH